MPFTRPIPVIVLFSISALSPLKTRIPSRAILLAAALVMALDWTVTDSELSTLTPICLSVMTKSSTSRLLQLRASKPIPPKLAVLDKSKSSIVTLSQLSILILVPNMPWRPSVSGRWTSVVPLTKVLSTSIPSIPTKLIPLEPPTKVLP